MSFSDNIAGPGDGDPTPSAIEPNAPAATPPEATSSPAAAPTPADVPPVSSQQPIRRTRPVLGVLWGIMFGLGLAIVAITLKVISLSLVSAIIVFVIGVAAGTAWSMFGPAKAPRTA